MMLFLDMTVKFKEISQLNQTNKLDVMANEISSIKEIMIMHVHDKTSVLTQNRLYIDRL